MTTPTTVLRAEHEIIQRALDVLDAAADRLERGAPHSDGWWRRLLEWFREFADRTHHAKEEQALFPALTRAGVPVDGGPIGVMLAEHQQGRDLIAAMASTDGAPRAASARRYGELLRAHILKENEVLFPMADAVLDETARQRLAREFAALVFVAGPGGSTEHAAAVLDRIRVDPA